LTSVITKIIKTKFTEHHKSHFPKIKQIPLIVPLVHYIKLKWIVTSHHYDS